MGSFKRSLFGYRRDEVDAALLAREAELASLRAESTELAGMVIEREREIRGLSEALREAGDRHERSIASLARISDRLEEIQAQARGQATRIRMKALREAVEVSRRVEAMSALADGGPAGAEGDSAVAEDASAVVEDASAVTATEEGLFEGELTVEIGPLGDFSQLVGFEDAIGQIGASEISVERFSEGRATVSMRLDEPTELLRELEQLSALDFRVRRTAPDNLILDLDQDQGPEQRAA